MRLALIAVRESQLFLYLKDIDVQQIKSKCCYVRRKNIPSDLSKQKLLTRTCGRESKYRYD